MERDMKVAEWGVVGALLVALALAGNARADHGDVATAPEYLEYLAELRGGFEEGVPRSLSKREQRMFDEADQNIRSLLAGKDSIDDLPNEQAVSLYSSQEQIKAILSGAEDNRVICRREARAGTHFRETRCVSAELRASQQEAAQDLLRRAPAWWREEGGMN